MTDPPRDVSISNPDKVLWPATGFAKKDLVADYVAVAPVLLPHVAGRPLTLARWPDGVDGPGWYQANCPRPRPASVRVAPALGKRGQRLEYTLLDDAAGLAWAANLAAIELHPFLADATAPDVPRELVLDLDPGAPATILEAATVALVLRERLAAEGFVARVKTSGAKGLHLSVRLDGTRTFAETKPWARRLADELARSRPDLVVATMARAARAGRVYVDWGQNDPTKSTVAAYSLRATPVPRVSTPFAWDEVERAVAKRDVALLSFGPDEVLQRTARLGDLWS